MLNTDTVMLGASVVLITNEYLFILAGRERSHGKELLIVWKSIKSATERLR